MNNTALVTAVIPSYNHAKYIKESIQSMIEQNYENIEMIIIDDGSSDNSIEIIESMIPLCKKRFKRFEFRHRENKGLCATLNEAIIWANGEYISILASDDIALSHKISFLIGKIENSNYPAVFGDIKRIGERNDKEPNIKEFTIHIFDEIFTLQNRPFAPSSMYKIEALKKIGGYPVDIAVEDWYMELKFTENNNKIVSYPEVLTYYRRHEKNTSKNYELIYNNFIKIVDNYKNHKLYFKARKLCDIYLIKISLANNCLSPTLNMKIDKIISQAKKYSQDYNKIAIYGNGTIYNLIKNHFENIVAVFDKNQKEHDIYFKPDKIVLTNFDIIIVTAIGYEDDIINFLTSNYNIDINKIKIFDI